jgi:hypothetical protein
VGEPHLPAYWYVGEVAGSYPFVEFGYRRVTCKCSPFPTVDFEYPPFFTCIKFRQPQYVVSGAAVHIYIHAEENMYTSSGLGL